MNTTGQYTVRPLDTGTWSAYVQMLDKHHGAGFGSGCWCTWFHPRAETGNSDESGRACKERLVRESKAHAAVVFDGDMAVGWCQFGTPEELPNIHHRKEYETGLVRPPDYRITCIFVDRNHRRTGVAKVALDGALGLIAGAGGGVVEGYPHDTAGKKFSATFLYNGTRSLYEEAGFDYERPKGKNNCVMRKVIPAPSVLSRTVTAGSEQVRDLLLVRTIGGFRRPDPRRAPGRPGKVTTTPLRTRNRGGRLWSEYRGRSPPLANRCGKR
jgi:GNAT superfamily N-acetyltransferase